MIFTLGNETGNAWSSHDLITAFALEDIGWIDEFPEIIITSYPFEPDLTLGHDFKILYTSPITNFQFPPEGEFLNYSDPNATYKPLKKGLFEGEKISAREILIQFSSEPDWDMDSGMDFSFIQKFMGGSQGARHMYYPSWRFKFPNLIFPQGYAPERAMHFFTLAKRAHKLGDLYWTFRLLARAIHYVEDLGQPFHVRQTSTLFLPSKTDFSVDAITTSTKNYHLAFESLVSNILSLIAAGNPDMLNIQKSLKNGRILNAQNVKELAKLIAKESDRNASSTFLSSIEVLGSEFKCAKKIDFEEKHLKIFLNSLPKYKTERFYRNLREDFHVTSTGIMSIMVMAQREIFGL